MASNYSRHHPHLLLRPSTQTDLVLLTAAVAEEASIPVAVVEIKEKGIEIKVNLVGPLTKTRFMARVTGVELAMFLHNVRTATHLPFGRDSRPPIMLTLAHKRPPLGSRIQVPTIMLHLT